MKNFANVIKGPIRNLFMQNLQLEGEGPPRVSIPVPKGLTIGCHTSRFRALRYPKRIRNRKVLTMQVRLPVVAVSLAMLLGSAGCSQDILTSVSYKTEEFIQNERPKVDILWVVDNSNSMAANQAGIGQSFQAFINNLVTTQVDYHIGVVSSDITDSGRLHSGVSGEVYITPNTIAAPSAFLENVQVGINGSAVERSFESAALALGVGIGTLC